MITETTIDNILSNDLSSIKTSYHGVLEVSLSDHLPIFSICPSVELRTPKLKNLPSFKRLFNTNNINKFHERLSAVDWQPMAEAANSNFVIGYKIFSSTINKHFNSCFPQKRVLNRKSNHKPWVTPELQKLCSQKISYFRFI